MLNTGQLSFAIFFIYTGLGLDLNEVSLAFILPLSLIETGLWITFQHPSNIHLTDSFLVNPTFMFLSFLADISHKGDCCYQSLFLKRPILLSFYCFSFS